MSSEKSRSPGCPPFPHSYSIPSPPSATTGYAGNGNVLSFMDLINAQSTSRAATYDTLNRLLTFTSTPSGGSSTTLTWSYDRFGNRTSQTGEAQVSYPAGNNRASTSSGYAYDASGNVIEDPSNQYGYDGEGRLCTVYNKTLAHYTGYAYDGLGNRVASGGGPNSLSCDSNLTMTSSFVVGPNGEQLDELSSTGAGYSNVYANGQLLATYQFPTSNWTYALNDWLGTKRVVANATGAQGEYCLSQPFGDGLACSGAGDPSPQHFTGKERDAESNNDYFGARYYRSSMGRFMSPDWSKNPQGVPYADFTNPQSLNLYGYVNNNPLSKADKDGHDWDSAIVTTTTVAGGFIGGILGGATGAGAGTLVAPGVGTVGGGIEGAVLGSTGGALAGAGLGKAIVGALNTVFSSDKPSTLAPGPNAGDGIPARSSDRNFKPEEREAVNAEGADKGCHTCGTKDPGTKSGNFVPDHQPPTALNPAGAEQKLYPQCISCSRTQGGEVNAAKQQTAQPATQPDSQPQE